MDSHGLLIELPTPAEQWEIAKETVSEYLSFQKKFGNCGDMILYVFSQSFNTSHQKAGNTLKCNSDQSTVNCWTERVMITSHWLTFLIFSCFCRYLWFTLSSMVCRNTGCLALASSMLIEFMSLHSSPAFAFAAVLVESFSGMVTHC